MKILHFSDTHLGFNDLDIVNDDGINQREADFYDAFRQVIDAALKTKPDYVIHTGDLFHRPHPTNRAITFCLAQLKRLSSAKIKTVIIAGNHSTPRTITASPILAALETLDFVYPVFSEAYQKVIFDDIVFHAIPHINDEAKNLQAIETCEKEVASGVPNILMMHCSVGAAYLMEEYAERVFPPEKEKLFTKMAYVALGHWHGFGSVGRHGNVYYAGSTERTSAADTRSDKGFALVTLGDVFDVTFQPVSIRQSIRLAVNGEEDIYERLRQHKEENDISGALLYITLKNLTAAQSIDITNKAIASIFKDALHVSVKREFKSALSMEIAEDINASSLQDLFLEYLHESVTEEKEFERLSGKVAGFFADYDEAARDTE